MKKLLMVSALMLAVAAVMVPVSGSAALYNQFSLWQAAVSSYQNVTPPASDLNQYAEIALPPGGGGYLNFNVPLDFQGDGFYYTNSFDGANYYANGSFYDKQPPPNDWQTFNITVSAFGFSVKQPALSLGFLEINLYTAQGGEISVIIDPSGLFPEFLGWVGDDVVGFSTWATAPFGMSNFVIGEVGTSVPEPSTLLLLGSGLLGLLGYGRKRMKK